MRKKLCTAFLVLLAIPLLAYQWPVSGPVVVGTFAQNSFGGFLRGISIVGRSPVVQPVERGELVFYSTGPGGAGVPSVLGEFAVIEHQGNLRSVYGHLALDKELSEGGKTFFEAHDELGSVGDSGIAEGAQLFLSVRDLELEQTVNPCLILPPLEDRTRPVIRNATLKSGNTEVTLPPQGGLPAGQWEISMDIFDEASVRYFRPTAVYRVAVYVNGQETFQLAFDAIKDMAGIPRVYPSKDLSWNDVYAGDWRMRLGTVDLRRGMANIEVIVRDFAGNERTQSFQFRVN